MIYIVDDAVDYRFLIQQVFKLFLTQYPLRLFADGLELIQAIEQPAALLNAGSVAPDAARPDYAGLDETMPGLVRPGLLVLDVDMPKLSGLQTLARLKQIPLWQEVPVVMMSNRIEPGFAETASQLGASSYIIKPMDIDELKESMAHLCHQWLDAQTNGPAS